MAGLLLLLLPLSSFSHFSSPSCSSCSLLLLPLLPTVQGFRFTVSRARGQGEEVEDLLQVGTGAGVKSVIVGLFDTFTGITRGVAGLMQEVDGGFNDIRGQEKNGQEEEKEEEQDLEELEVEEESVTNSTTGAKLVVGVFDALQGITKGVGRLVGSVEQVLGSSRDEVVELADKVEEDVGTLHTRIGDWVRPVVASLGDGTRNLSLSILNSTYTGQGSYIRLATNTSSPSVESSGGAPWVQPTVIPLDEEKFQTTKQEA